MFAEHGAGAFEKDGQSVCYAWDCGAGFDNKYSPRVFRISVELTKIPAQDAGVGLATTLSSLIAMGHNLDRFFSRNR
ncbi:MAG TPA: hypothetical protein PLN56_00285 [Methanoregulaceae archaeon]|nr:hypothetical protein [Methanoregulaceae archaeon]